MVRQNDRKLSRGLRIPVWRIRIFPNIKTSNLVNKNQALSSFGWDIGTEKSFSYQKKSLGNLTAWQCWSSCSKCNEISLSWKYYKVQSVKSKVSLILLNTRILFLRSMVQTILRHSKNFKELIYSKLELLWVLKGKVKFVFTQSLRHKLDVTQGQFLSGLKLKFRKSLQVHSFKFTRKFFQ